MPLSIFLLNFIVLLLINMNKNNFYVICEKIEQRFILHNKVLIHVSSYSINYVRSTQNKTVFFSLDLSDLQTPRCFQFKLSLKVFFLDKGVCMNQENFSCLMRGFPVPACERSGLFSSLCANSVQCYFIFFLSNIRSPVNPFQNNRGIFISDRCVGNRKFWGLSVRARKHPSKVLILPADQIVDMAAG